MVNTDTTDPFSPQFIDFSNFSTFGGNIQILRDNPFISPALAVLMNDNGVTSLYLERDNNDIGNRATLADRETVRFVTGFASDIMEGKMFFDASINYGKTTANLANRSHDYCLFFCVIVRAIVSSIKNV